MLVFACVFFFFSSRRRHTRLQGDWSSDVCSSDLLPPEIQHVVLDEGSANVLNALNNRLAAIGALADLLHGSPLDPERARALMMLHGEVRRAAEITQHFLELAQHPKIGRAHV